MTGRGRWQDNKVRIVQEGALAPLVFLLRSADELITQLAAGVLRNLASNLVNQVPGPPSRTPPLLLPPRGGTEEAGAGRRLTGGGGGR